jgi:hypothetical protein
MAAWGLWEMLPPFTGSSRPCAACGQRPLSGIRIAQHTFERFTFVLP